MFVCVTCAEGTAAVRVDFMADKYRIYRSSRRTNRRIGRSFAVSNLREDDSVPHELSTDVGTGIDGNDIQIIRIRNWMNRTRATSR